MGTGLHVARAGTPVSPRLDEMEAGPLVLLRHGCARGRVQPAGLWGGLFLVASQWVRVAISTTGAWLAFARWITG